MTQRTGEELDLAFSHLDYELDAFLKDAIYLADGARSTEWGNEILEAFLVHARVLAGFLGGMPQGERDIRPCDFGVEWSRPTSPEARSLKDDVDAISEHLAHLTWARVKVEDAKQWEFLGVTAKLLPIFIEFLEMLDEVHPLYARSLRARIDHYLAVAVSVPFSEGSS